MMQGMCEGQCNAHATVPPWVYSTWGTCSVLTGACNNACSATRHFVLLIKSMYHADWTCTN